MTRIESSKKVPGAQRYPGYADLETSILQMRLDRCKLNWLRQQQQPQQNNYVVHSNSIHDSLPELVGLFDNYSSADADMFDWQGNPNIYHQNDDINFSEIFPIESCQRGSDQLADDSAPQPEVNRCFSRTPAASCQIEDKEAAAVDNEKVVLIDDYSDDDVASIDHTQPITVIDEFSMFANIKTEFTAEEANNERRMHVEAAVESNGKTRSKVKTSLYYWNDDPLLQKLQCMRAQAKQRSRNPEHDSLAERKIKEKLQCLLNMIHGRNQGIYKSTGDMITELIVYLRFLENQKQYVQLLTKEASRQNPTPENNVNVTTQLFVEEVCLLAEEASRPNPTPNQNLVVNACGGRRRRDNFNKVAAKRTKKKSRGKVGSYRPAPRNSVAARNANFAYLTQQAAALYNPNCLAFASQLAPGTASPNWSIPQQYVQVPTYYSQDGPIGWDAETLSLLYQSYYSCC